MSLIQFNFESQYLYNNTTISVILPDKPGDVEAADFYASGKKYKVLWLLHGTFGDHSDWVRKSMIELYAQEHKLIVVMPSGLNADYTSWPGFALGFDMESHLIKELMPLIHNWFPASSKKEDNYIAGLSMGGQGVMQYILKYPELFHAAAVLSYPPIPMDRIDWNGDREDFFFRANNPRMINQIANAGGKEAFIAKNNLYQQILDMHEAGTLPKMIMGCGDKDFFYEEYCYFKEVCKEKNIPITFGELPDLGHEWRFWDKFIQTALEFFELEK